MAAHLGALALVLASLGLLLVAAKAHGRQVRLVREAAGFHEVTFGGENPPFVAELWRRDRRRFWTAAPAYAGVLAATAFLGGAAWTTVALAATLWPMVAAFVTAGVLGAGGALRANLGWWAAVVAASLAVAAFALTLP